MIVIASVNSVRVESADAVVSFIFNNDYGKDDLYCNRESAILAISQMNVSSIIHLISNLNNRLETDWTVFGGDPLLH